MKLFGFYYISSLQTKEKHYHSNFDVLIYYFYKYVYTVTVAGSPTQPRNLKTERHFDNGVLLIQLRWEPPQSNGGSTIEKYIVSYRPNELPWKQSTPSETKDSLFYNLRLQSGTTYHARVRAKNKAGISPPSNEVEINLGM